MNSNNKCRGVAQFGSALVSGTRGREFESRRPDQIKNFRNRMRMRFFLFLRLNTVFELLYKRVILSTICQQSLGTLGNMGYLGFIIRKNSCIKIENRHFNSDSLIFHKKFTSFLFNFSS